ncbi:hypothetical protein, partial [Burkholderia pseudomallei]|uniref:hypothetical protein n=1 Tax=Burkholderia pseudomallei TaxID=28450 RepID=UPI001C4AE67A
SSATPARSRRRPVAAAGAEASRRRRTRLHGGDDVRDAAGSVRRHVQHDAIPHGMTVFRRSSKQGQQ